MNLLTGPQLLVISGLIFVALELLVGVQTGFDLVMVGLAMLIGGGVGLLFASTSVGLLVTAALSIGYVIVGRRYLKAKLQTHHHPLNTDRLVGQTGLVTAAITPHRPGRVTVHSEEWRALSQHKIPTQTEVIIKKLDGVTLHVAPKKSSTTSI